MSTGPSRAPAAAPRIYDTDSARLYLPGSWPELHQTNGLSSGGTDQDDTAPLTSTSGAAPPPPFYRAPSDYGDADADGRDPLPDLLNADDRAFVGLLVDVDATDREVARLTECADALATGLGYGSLLPRSCEPTKGLEMCLKETRALQADVRSSANGQSDSLMYRLAAVVTAGALWMPLLQSYSDPRWTPPASTVLIDPHLNAADCAKLREEGLHNRLSDETHLLVVMTKSTTGTGVQALQRLFGARVEMAVAGVTKADNLGAIVTEYLSPRSLATRFDRLTSPPSCRASASRWRHAETGVANMRDLSVSHFPRGLVFRSADLQALDATDPQADRRWAAFARDVRVVIDLRSAPEVRKNGAIGAPVHPSPDTAATDRDAALDPSPATQAYMDRHHIRRIHAPIFTETDYSPAAIAKRHGLYKNGSRGFLQAYDGILRNVGPTLRVVVDEVCATLTARHAVRSGGYSDSGKGDTRGVLIHCSAGKDRTGILCALLLLLARVDPWIIAEEYGQTRVGLRERRAGIMKSAVALSAAASGPPEAPETDAARADGKVATASEQAARDAKERAELAALKMMDSPPHVMRVILDRLLSGAYSAPRDSGEALDPGDHGEVEADCTYGNVRRFFSDNGIPGEQLERLESELRADRLEVKTPSTKAASRL